MIEDLKVLCVKAILWTVISVFLIMSSVVYHELAHVVSCKNAGGEASISYFSDIQHLGITKCALSNVSSSELTVKKLSDNINETIGYHVLSLEYFLILAGFLFYSKEELRNIILKF